MSWEHWTMEETEYLKREWGVKPVRTIAENIGHTEKAVYAMARRSNMPKRAYTDADFAEDISICLNCPLKRCMQDSDACPLKKKKASF